MDARNYEAKAALKDGRGVIIRGIRPDDKAMKGRLDQMAGAITPGRFHRLGP